MSLSYSGGSVMPLPQLAWDFNGTTKDYITGLAGTTTGTITYGSGKYNQSVIFTNTAGSEASNALTYTLSSITSLTDGFSISCWFKINSVPPTGQRSGIWRIPATGTGNGGAYMLYYASGQTNFGYTQIDQAITYVEFSANFGSLVVGTWYHAVYTISGTTQTAYLNGVLKATDTRLTATYTQSNPTMSLGYHNNFGDAFNGEVDDFRVYKTALTAAQVKAIYAAQGMPNRALLTLSAAGVVNFFNSNKTILTGNLVLYLDPASYPGSGTTYTDLSGAGHNFTKNSGTYITSPIKCFQAGIFNATNFITDNLTIQVWINATGVGTQTVHYRLMQIMSAEIAGNPGDPTDFGFGINSNGKLAFGTGPSDVTIATTASVNTGTWLNVAVTRTKSSGAVKLYINGVVDKSGTSGSGNALNVQTNLQIGAGTDGGTNWSGYMGVFLTYSSVLSDADILTNFSATRSIYGI